MAGPQVKIAKAGLYKMISYKGTSGTKKYTPMTAAVQLGKTERSMQIGMKSVVAGINSLGSVLNSISANSEAMVSSMKQSIGAQIADNQALIKREKELKKEEDARKAREERERRKKEEKEKRDEAEKGSEAPLFKKIREQFKESAKSAFGGFFMALARFATAFLKFFLVYKALDWIANNPKKIEKLAKGLFALGKFVFKVTSFLVGSGLDGITKFLENPLSLKGFFGAVQFVLSAAPIFIGLAFLKNPVGTVKALGWVIASLGKGIMGMHKQGKLMGRLKAFKSTRMARLAGGFTAGAMAFTGAQLDGSNMAEALGAGGGAMAGQMIGAKVGSMIPVPGAGVIGGVLGGAVGAPVGKAIGGLIEPIVEPMKRFFGMVGDVFNNVMGAIKEPLTGLFQGIADVMSTILDVVEPHLPLIGTLVGGGLKIVLTPFMLMLKALTAVLKFFAPKKGGGEKGGIAEASQKRAAGGPIVVPSPIPQMASGGNAIDAGPIQLVSTSLKKVTEMGAGIGKVMILPFKAIGIGILSAIGMVGRLFGRFLPGPLKTIMANSLAPIARAFGVPLSVLGADVGGTPKGEDQGKEEPDYQKELLEIYTGEGGVLENFGKLLDVVTTRDMVNRGLGVLSDLKTKAGFAKGGWISGPMSGYPVSLDGGRSTSFIGHGTEWVGYKGFAAGGAYVVPFNTPATRKNAGLTSLRMRQAAAGGYALPFSAGGALDPTIPRFSAGGKFMSPEEKRGYEKGMKHTWHFQVGDKEYGAAYTKSGNDINIKQLSRVDDSGGWFGWGQKKPPLQPGSPEFNKVLNSEALRYAIAKHANLKSGGNRRGHGAKIDPSLINKITTDKLAGRYYTFKTTPRKERERLEEEHKKAQEPVESLEKLLMDFGAKMAEAGGHNIAGAKLDEAQLKEVEAQNQKQKDVANAAQTVIAQEVDKPPIITGGGNEVQEIVVPGSTSMDADPFLMPKFGLVPEFTTNVSDMM